MISTDQAASIIKSLVQPLTPTADAEQVDLWAAAHRILAQSVASPLDFPHWDNSAMDGYAVRFEDVQQASDQQPVDLTVIEEIPAGVVPQRVVNAGEAARILTGAMMPAGADTVVMQEVTQRSGDRIQVLTAPQLQSFVRRQGAFHRVGEQVLPAGTRLGAPEIAVLAAVQCSPVWVYRPVRVVILSTGNELVSPTDVLKPGQIVDSNQYALAAAVAQAGAMPIPLGVVPDDPAALEQAIAHALTVADLVISSGGVSVGDYDYVEHILESLGGTLHIRSVAIKPGKPLTIATFERSHLPPHPEAPPSLAQPLYIGLPGNPVSALVTFWRFVLPALHQLSGLATGWGPTFVMGRSPQDLQADGKRETYLWGRLHSTGTEFEFTLAAGSHNSANLINLAQTNALAVVPTGTTHIPAGTPLRILQIPVG